MDATIGESGAQRPRESALRPMPQRGERVGRYIIVGELGAGAMGVVCAAYDPELDRKVALKLLHPRRDSGSTEGRQRLVREAQAMAKVSHPNVVAVHDVGEHERGVFVAMEFIEGQTLRQWLDERPRSQAEVLAMFAEAGRGLSAAHAAALVHRDFKPENVMVGDDGRVRVLDFGLVRPLQAPAPKEDASTARAELSDSADAGVTTQTRVGAVMGTPAYMSPEQLSATEVDARSDQFGFCVALYESLYGERPFSGESYQALVASVLLGELREPPRRSTVPGWLRRVLQKGLSIDPAQRYASMEALLSALDADPSRRRKRWLIAGVVVAAAGGLWATSAWMEAHVRDECVAKGRAIEDTFDPSSRAAVRDALLSHGLPFTEEAWARVEPGLDEYLGAWGDACEHVCVATEVEKRWPAARADAALDCLHESRAAAQALIALLSEVDLEVAVHADSSVSWLPQVSRCLDVELLDARSVVEADAAEAVRSLRQDAAAARMLWQAGKSVEGRARLQAVKERAVALGDVDALASVNDVQASFLAQGGEHDTAAKLWRSSFFAWGRLDNERRQRATAVALATMEAEHLGRVAVARDWLALATMFHERIEGADGEPSADVLHAEAVVLTAEGDYGEAKEVAEQALALAIRNDGAEHPRTAKFRIRVADIEHRRGNYAEALALSIDELELLRRQRGEKHPEVGRAMLNVATLHATLGDLAAAKANATEALKLVEATMGPNHPWTAAALRTLASVLSKGGKIEEAIALLERSVALDDYVSARSSLGGLLIRNGEHGRAVPMLRAAYDQQVASGGDRHPDLVAILVNLGAAYGGSGDNDNRAWAYREAIAVAEQALAPDHPMVSYALHNLGSVYRDEERWAEARVLFERALKIREDKLGKDHPMTASTLGALGHVSLDEGHPEQAQQHFARALEILAKAGAYPERQAELRFGLGRAIAASDGPRAEVEALLRQAYAGYGDVGDKGAGEAVTQWSREHGFGPLSE